jgi:HPt (histidine-containing phosphotransfer) domain-containing protein
MDNNILDAVSLARFEELSDGDPDGLRDLIQLYIVKTTEQMKELEGALESKASAHVARIAHSLVGANAMVGLDSLVPLLRLLEGHGEKQQIDEARAVYTNLHKRFQAIQTQLQKKLDSLPKP